ncbi:MAG: NifB/NifX family molybdenum-iron cluster-binding protein [Bryobacteraceae bacterium]
MTLRIGVGTTDGVSLCEHLARSTEFVIFEIENGRVVSRSVRRRDPGECGRHSTFVEMLEGCEIALCGGIGGGAAKSLSAAGILPVVAAGRHTMEDAVALYLAGTLPTTDERVCLCG